MRILRINHASPNWRSVPIRLIVTRPMSVAITERYVIDEMRPTSTLVAPSRSAYSVKGLPEINVNEIALTI